jgi:hypothetical protein
MSEPNIKVTIDLETYSVWYTQQTGQTTVIQPGDEFYIRQGDEYELDGECGYSTFGWCSCFIPTRFLKPTDRISL